jgi:hypothetical protein
MPPIAQSWITILINRLILENRRAFLKTISTKLHRQAGGNPYTSDSGRCAVYLDPALAALLAVTGNMMVFPTIAS